MVSQHPSFAESLSFISDSFTISLSEFKALTKYEPVNFLNNYICIFALIAWSSLSNISANFLTTVRAIPLKFGKSILIMRLNIGLEKHSS